MIPVTIWLTGRSGVGKTTIALELKRRFQTTSNKIQILDGDEVRGTICAGLGFSRADRIENNRRITYMAELLKRNEISTIVAAISPYSEARDLARMILSPHFYEIYVTCTPETLEQRDPKGLYAKGIVTTTDEYEIPTQPDLIINTSICTVNEAIFQIQLLTKI